jgi:hypothetical protein
MSWNQTLQDYSIQLNSIAEWASIVNLGTVRDYCRLAKHEISKEQERINNNAFAAEKHDLIKMVEWYRNEYHKSNEKLYDELIENIRNANNPDALEIYKKVVDGWMDC